MATDSTANNANEVLQQCNDYPTYFGKPSSVRDRLQDTLPGTSWESDGTGHFVTDQYGLEISLYDTESNKCLTTDEDGESLDVKFIFIDVAGGGNPVLPLVTLAKANGWQLIDTASDEGYSWIDLDNPSEESWENFKTYRDHTMKNQTDE